MLLQEQSQARSRALLCTDNTQCFTCFVCFFPDHQSYIYYLILNQQIYPVIIRMMILDKSDSQRKIKHKTCRYFVYIQHALFYLLCLPLFPGSKLPDACRENDILIKSSWYPSKVWSSANSDILGNGSWYPQINLVTHRNFWMYPPEVLLIS